MDKCIKNTAKSNYFKYFGKKASLTALYGFFVISLLALGYFFPVSLILSIPLIFVPLTFGYIAANGYINTGKGNYTYLFTYFKAYFSQTFMGGFSGWKGFLKSLVVYFIWVTIMTLIMVFGVILKNTEVMDLFNSYTSSTGAEAVDAFNKLVSHPVVLMAEFYIDSVALGFGFYTFLHHILSKTIVIDFVLYSQKGTIVRDLKRVHRFMFHKIRKDFYLNYYSRVWIIAVLYLIGYSGGLLLGFFVLKCSGVQASVLGLFGSFILCMFILPYIFDMIEQLYIKHSKDYLMGFLEYSEHLIKTNLKDQSISDAQRQELLDVIENQKEELETFHENLKKEKAKKEDSSNEKDEEK